MEAWALPRSACPDPSRHLQFKHVCECDCVMGIANIIEFSPTFSDTWLKTSLLQQLFCVPSCSFFLLVALHLLWCRRGLSLGTMQWSRKSSIRQFAKSQAVEKVCSGFASLLGSLAHCLPFPRRKRTAPGNWGSVCPRLLSRPISNKRVQSATQIRQWLMLRWRAPTMLCGACRQLWTLQTWSPRASWNLARTTSSTCWMVSAPSLLLVSLIPGKWTMCCLTDCRKIMKFDTCQ